MQSYTPMRSSTQMALKSDDLNRPSVTGTRPHRVSRYQNDTLDPITPNIKLEFHDNDNLTLDDSFFAGFLLLRPGLSPPLQRLNHNSQPALRILLRRPRSDPSCARRSNPQQSRDPTPSLEFVRCISQRGRFETWYYIPEKRETRETKWGLFFLLTGNI